MRAPSKPLRFLGSAAIAAVVVFVLMVAVLWGFGLVDLPEDNPILAHPVDALSDSIDVAELVGEPRQLPPPPREPPPAFELPRRQVSGFVQVEVSVGPDGRVREAQVVNAVPEGLYEEQALEIVRARRYVPPPDGRTIDEVVPFSVPAPQEEADGFSE
jgi:TonB family protein